MEEDSLWRKIKVIFSGSEVPGEGEHKIMEYIRYHKSTTNWKPNVTHCIYGLDADLIMLSLATHEPFFCLLREEVIFDMKAKNLPKKEGDKQTFQLLHVKLLREYLEWDFSELEEQLPFNFDIERIIDDFVLICFLIGNDFVPCLPCRDINEGAVNDFFEIYKSLLPKLDGYLMENGKPVLQRLQRFFSEISIAEKQMLPLIFTDSDKYEESESLKLSKILYGESNGNENCWKAVYYKQKFDKNLLNSNFINDITKNYIEALCWICGYYYHGCPSWNWYFNYHYAPLSSDLENIMSLDIKFNLSTPFLPLQQLLAVLPPASSDLLPVPFQDLLKNDFEMKYYYPDTFDLDLNGKQNSWEAVVIIPFMPEDLIKNKTRMLDSLLSSEEKERNKFSYSEIYTYDPDTKISVKSALPSIFNDITPCHVKYSLIAEQVPHIENPFVIVPEYHNLKYDPPGFPTLRSLNHFGQVVPVNVNVFGFNSKKDSLLIVLEDDSGLNLDEKIKYSINNILGNVCYTWPFNREVLVVGLSESEKTYNMKKQSFYQPGTFKKDSEHYQTKWYNTKAVDLGNIEILASTRPLIGVVRERDGSSRKIYSNVIEQCPFNILLEHSMTERDPRFDTIKYVKNWKDEYPIGSKVICTQKGPLFGALCEVISIEGDDGYKKS